MASSAGVRSEISNSVGRANERERKKGRERESKGEKGRKREREEGRERARRREMRAGRREKVRSYGRETQGRGRVREGEKSRKVPQGNGYQNCACHYNFKAGFPRSFSLASPPVLPRPYTSVGWRQEWRARERGKGRKRGRAGPDRARERGERLGGRGNAGNPREGGSFISPLYPSERARARGIIYREDSRESTQRASERASEGEAVERVEKEWRTRASPPGGWR